MVRYSLLCSTCRKRKKKLDKIILKSGIQENDLITSFNETSDPTQLSSNHYYTEVSYTKIKTKYIQINGKLQPKETTVYVYDKGKKYSSILTRAIINTLNPELAAYGYVLYEEQRPGKDLYVPYDDMFSLYIPMTPYMNNEKEVVDKAIRKGLENVSSCTKSLQFPPEDIDKLFNEIIESDLYKNILKL
jgi:hypothetical protein